MSDAAIVTQGLRRSFGPTTRVLLQSLAWIVGILVVFVPLAVGRYRRAAG